MKSNFRFAAMVAALGLSAGCTSYVYAQNTGKMSMAGSDHTFAMKAAQGGMAEVELGNLAVQKASSPDVKQFGQRMVDDHSKANDQLKEVAGKDKLSLPTGIDAKDQALKNRLEKLSGKQFDEAYMNAMVRDHRTDVSEFQKEANHGNNPDLKSFAANTLPTLQDHLRMAQDTMSKVKGSQGMASREQK
ncbi:MAG: DUF4142 domain-containing protein [Bryobacteraceae bacterium]